MRSVSFPSLERAMYFCFAEIFAMLHVEPLQLIPSLFAVTLGTPVVSVTMTSTWVPEQTGIWCAFSLRDSGSTMVPVMKLATFGLLDGL